MSDFQHEDDMRHWVSGCFAAAALRAAVPIHAQSQWTLRRGAPAGAEVVEIDLLPIAVAAFQVVAVIGILVLAYLLLRRRGAGGTDRP